MTTVEYYEGEKYTNDQSKIVVDALTVEGALQIVINGVPFTVTMRTPSNDVALIHGLLHAEDVYRQGVPLGINFEYKNKVMTIAKLQIPKQHLGNGYKNSRTLLSVASCGICGRTALDDTELLRTAIQHQVIIKMDVLYQLFDIMKDEQKDFLQSGGSHAAAAFAANGQLLTVMEDIGRHNAVDKVIGNLLLNKQLDQAVGLLVSGRISYEIIAKAYHANIPILAAVSAPSSLAVEYAKQLGITLLGFCRGQKATCYAHPQRICG